MAPGEDFGLDLSQYSDGDLDELESMYGGMPMMAPDGSTEFEQPEFAGENMGEDPSESFPDAMSLPPEMMGKLSSEQLEVYTDSLIKTARIQGVVMAQAFYDELGKLMEGHTKVASSDGEIQSELYNALQLMLSED